MKVSEYRDIASALGRFATSRETAQPPESVIGIQNKNGALKFIAGTDHAGIVIGTTDYTSSEDGAFTISARTFLQAAKALPARSNVDILLSKDRLTIKTEGGGRIDLNSVGSLKDAGFPKKPKEHVATGSIPAAEWSRISKLFKTVSAKVEVPCVQYMKGRGYVITIAPGNRSSYVNLSFPATSEIEEYAMAAYRDFWDGLTALSGDGVIQWSKNGVIASDGKVEVFSAAYLVHKQGEEPHEVAPWPVLLNTGHSDISITMPRRQLIDIVRGQAPFDEQNRVTLNVDTGKLLVTPFGVEEGQEVLAGTSGKGFRSVSAGYLNNILTNMDSKEVTLRWGAGMPAVSITSEEYENWTILLAPTAI
jgi:hypothetical protein